MFHRLQITLYAVLIVFGGLPGVGKTAIARELARELRAVFVRIDSIEFALRESGRLAGPMEDAGYRVAYAIAEDNLRGGQTVIADCVNPLRITRQAWRAAASRAATAIVEVEIVCSDPAQHRRRVDTRGTDFPGWTLSWQEVVERDYEPWDRDCVRLDSATIPPEAHVAALARLVRAEENARRAPRDAS
jgi:predicted kinase